MALGVHRVPDIARQLKYSGEHGNLSVAYAKVIVPATGVNGDTIDFFEMPVGTRLVDCLFRNTGDTNGATTTLALGIAQKPGGPSTKVDADALLTAAVLTTGNRLVNGRNNAGVDDANLTLDGTYLIQGVLAAADIGTNPVTMECWLTYENRGTP